MDINGKQIKFRIDTGADVTIINTHTAKSINLPIKGEREGRKHLVDAGGKRLQKEGYMEAELTYKERRANAEIHIIKGAPQNLLGIKEIDSLDILQRVNGIEIEDQYPGLYRRLGQLPETFKIRLKEGAEPLSLPVPRRLPLGLREATERELKRMEDMGVIERVETHRDWCAGMVVAPKSSGEVRICVDLTRLNKSVKRENYPLPRVEETLALLEGSQIFSKMDANSGFWQIELEKQSREFTTFITPFGRFQFRKMPFGISAAPEFFQRQMTKILEGLEGVTCMMDDILVFGREEREHDERLKKVLKRLEESGMTLNRDKCEFKVREVKFLGHLVSGKGISADPEKVKAITEMEPPKNKSELKSFLGMVNYLSKFSGRLAELERPLRELQKNTSDWIWDSQQQRGFEEVKREIIAAPTLAKYELRAKHRVTADSSSYALGAALLQQNREGEWQPVAFVSRKLTEAERKYAQIEKEALAITWACGKFDYYLVGTIFEVETDHKPLVKLLGESDLSDLPLRCQRFKLRLMRYNFTIFHTPGSKMILADLLSRPAGVPTPKEERRAKKVEMHVGSILLADETLDDMMTEEIRKTAAADILYNQVVNEVESGWTQRGKNYKGEVQRYWTQRDRLSTHQGLIMRDHRLVIPRDLREEMTERIHRGHLCADKCIKRAKDSVWWPDMQKEIRAYVENCNECIMHRRMGHLPLKNSYLPEKPWESIATDLFEFKNRDYLLTIDYYTRWIEVVELSNKTAESVVKKMKGMFARYGVPKTIRSDNGPCYKAKEFREFTQEWRVNHITSSPHHPESNGLAERAVGTVKRMWKKERDKQLALMVYRNTPLDSGKSPSELLFCRNLRTNLPRGSNTVTEEQFKERDLLLKRDQKKHTDRRRRAKTQADLNPGDVVWVKTAGDDAGQRGMVINRRAEPYSYDVQIRNKTLRRTRIHLRKLQVETPTLTFQERERTQPESEEETSSEEEVSEGEENNQDQQPQPPEQNRPTTSRTGRLISKGHLSKDYSWGGKT